jgi:DNA-binding transcriptional ArsR family regulator
MDTVPSEIFKAMSVETRIKIIDLLKVRGPLGGNDIAELIGITPAAVSQHLKILRQAGLVRNERKGYWIPYSIDEEGMEKCRQTLNDICSCGCQGTGEFREQELNDATLASLREYERELENELQTVRERISEITKER